MGELRPLGVKEAVVHVHASQPVQRVATIDVAPIDGT